MKGPDRQGIQMYLHFYVINQILEQELKQQQTKTIVLDPRNDMNQSRKSQSQRQRLRGCDLKRVECSLATRAKMIAHT